MLTSTERRTGARDSPTVYDAPIDYGVSRALFETRTSTSTSTSSSTGWTRPPAAPAKATASASHAYASAYNNQDAHLQTPHTAVGVSSGTGQAPAQAHGAGTRARGQAEGYMPLTDIITGLQQMIRSCHEVEGQQQRQHEGYALDRRHPSLTRPTPSALLPLAAAGAGPNANVSLGQWSHVPYAGGPSGNADAVRVRDLGQAQSAPRVQLLRSGRLRPVGELGDHRKASLPYESRASQQPAVTATATLTSTPAPRQSTLPRAARGHSSWGNR